MKRSLSFILVPALLFLCFVFIFGCGTGGGGGGGGTPIPTFIADIYVSTTGSDEAPDGDGSRDKPYRTIWKGLSEAAEGETVGLFDGTYVLTTTLTWPATSYVTLRGESRDNTVITSNGGGPAFRFHNINPSPIAITIETLTVSNCANANTYNHGAVYYAISAKGHFNDLVFFKNKATSNAFDCKGGALNINNGAVTIDNCVFRENHVDVSGFSGTGGALYINSDASVTARNCIFEQNTASGQSGGIYNLGNILLQNCSFISNEAGTGNYTGALYIMGWDAVATIESCLFKHNSADYGGAMTIWNSIVSIKDSTFEANSATAMNGGAIFIDSDNVIIERSRFIDNHANLTGGAIHMVINATLRLENCILHENYSPNGAGGIHKTNSLPLYVINSSLVSNETGVGCNGAAIYGSGNMYILNSIVRNNGDTSGVVKELWCNSGVSTIEYSAIDPNTVNDKFDTVNCTSEAPVFASSPLLALDSGCPISITGGGTDEGTYATPPTDDILGNPRSVPYSMGAYEY